MKTALRPKRNSMKIPTLYCSGNAPATRKVSLFRLLQSEKGTGGADLRAHLNAELRIGGGERRNDHVDLVQAGKTWSQTDVEEAGLRAGLALQKNLRLGGG